MELRHLRYFVAIGEEQHYGRAARRLHVAQPALSRQIHDLAEELGFQLFERLPRGVRLSAAGKLFLVLLGHKNSGINNIEAIDLNARMLLSEMTAHSGRIQSVDEIYALLRTAGARKQPVVAMYEGHPRRSCPHVLGRSKQGRRNSFCYQFGGTSERFKDGCGGSGRLALHCRRETQPSRVAIWGMAHGAAIESPDLR
jgi:hypothetical protein